MAEASNACSAHQDLNVRAEVSNACSACYRYVKNKIVSIFNICIFNYKLGSAMPAQLHFQSSGGVIPSLAFWDFVALIRMPHLCLVIVKCKLYYSVYYVLCYMIICYMCANVMVLIFVVNKQPY